MHRRVLFISYAFPPVGGAGVQRTSKFVKYLPEAGWTPSVLTASNPSVPVFDHTLLTDIPQHVRVVRARTWEPSYAMKRSVSAKGGSGSDARTYRHFVKQSVRNIANLILQPDPQILWRMAAVRAGVRLLREISHTAIVASGPPFSSFLIGSAISQRMKVPLILDYRDEWDLSNSCWENKQFGALSLARQRKLQYRVVQQAAALLTTSRPSAHALGIVRDKADATAEVHCLYNGFDPDDFKHVEPCDSLAGGKYRLVYVGTLWNLTTSQPLVEAIRRLDSIRPDLASRVELVFAGRRTPHEESLLSRLKGLRCQLTLLPYLEHSEAIKVMSSASTLCALLADSPGAERVVPAKIFEYFATRRPVIVIAPKGELWHIASQHPNACCLLPSDVDRISTRLIEDIEKHGRPTAEDVVAAFDDSMFSRKQQAVDLAQILNSVAYSEPSPISQCC